MTLSRPPLVSLFPYWIWTWNRRQLSPKPSRGVPAISKPGVTKDNRFTMACSVKFYTNGSWEDGPGRTLHPITNPATGEVIAQVPYANADDVDRSEEHTSELQSPM